ncbi:MAG TPA: hypothetical protein VFC68_04485 [Treponemataceae bacterium]|nr:hypothetical protein [Treponemataceae bacterium]
MSKYQIRTFLGLVFLYSIIILGIFAFQFRNETSITNVFGNVKLRLATTRNNEDEPALKNNFQVSTAGITLFCNDSHPVKLTLTDGTVVDLKVRDWKKMSDTRFTIEFTEHTNLHFTTFDTKAAVFSVSAELPKNARRMTIPYKSVGAYTVTDYKTTQALFNSHSSKYVLNAQNIATQTFSLTASNNLASYGEYVESKTFNFNTIVDYELAKSTKLDTSITTIKSQIIAHYPVQKNSITSETTIAAWVAEKAARGNYSQGIKEVPSWFTDGSNRTYITTPYFNSLKEMNKTLNMMLENISFSMINSLSKQTLEIFEIHNFSDLLKTKSDASCKTVLGIPSKVENFSPTISQATGILHVYNEIRDTKPSAAAQLESVLNLCVKKIEAACVANDQTVTIIENKEPVKTLLAVKTGYELKRFGIATSQNTLVAAGTLIINSALVKNQILDMRTLGELYKILCSKTNNLYPHMQILSNNNTSPVWAWTCAQKLTYSEDTNTDTITINCTFPQGESHYVIINGIKPFTEIEIYGIAFRSDPRFEWYNSSGYAYDEKTNTLFLKYRQKSATETVTLLYHTPQTQEESPTNE